MLAEDTTRALTALACLALMACDPSAPKALTDADCKPKKLARMTACHGETSGFQECRFYFRATGIPDRPWCEAMLKLPPSAEPSLPACDFTLASAWRRVTCADYNIVGDASCFACTVAQHEAGMVYVYAYSSDCAQGLEQVTCNFEPHQAGAKLGPARF